jgi:hypothetical protein
MNVEVLWPGRRHQCAAAQGNTSCGKHRPNY